MPVQRIPRYVLLLDTLLKHTNVDHPDYQAIQQALSKVEHVASYVNEQKRRVEDMSRMLDLQTQVIGLPPGFTIVDASRRLIHDGIVRQTSSTSASEILTARPVRLFLFNDMMLFTDMELRFRSYWELKKLHLIGLREVPGFAIPLRIKSGDEEPQAKGKKKRVSVVNQESIIVCKDEGETKLWWHYIHDAIQSMVEIDQQKAHHFGQSGTPELLSSPEAYDFASHASSTSSTSFVVSPTSASPSRSPPTPQPLRVQPPEVSNVHSEGLKSPPLLSRIQSMAASSASSLTPSSSSVTSTSPGMPLSVQALSPISHPQDSSPEPITLPDSASTISPSQRPLPPYLSPPMLSSASSSPLKSPPMLSAVMASSSSPLKSPPMLSTVMASSSNEVAPLKSPPMLSSFMRQRQQPSQPQRSSPAHSNRVSNVGNMASTMNESKEEPTMISPPTSPDEPGTLHESPVHVNASLDNNDMNAQDDSPVLLSPPMLSSIQQSQPNVLASPPMLSHVAAASSASQDVSSSTAPPRFSFDAGALARLQSNPVMQNMAQPRSQYDRAPAVAPHLHVLTPAPNLEMLEKEVASLAPQESPAQVDHIEIM